MLQAAVIHKEQKINQVEIEEKVENQCEELMKQKRGNRR